VTLKTWLLVELGQWLFKVIETDAVR